MEEVVDTKHHLFTPTMMLLITLYKNLSMLDAILKKVRNHYYEQTPYSVFILLIRTLIGY